MNIVKNLAYKLLPDVFINWMKVHRYSKQFKSFTAQDVAEAQVFRKLIAPNSTVLDLGANIGLYAKLFSDIVGKKGKVYAIEPIPFTFSILTRNVRLSHEQNIFPFQFAVSDTNGRAEMVIPTYKDQHGMSSNGDEYTGEGLNYYTATLEFDETLKENSISVPLLTIDEFVDKNMIENISFIKCDVEGHELAAMIGARNIIERFKPSLYIEVSSDPRVQGTNGYELFSFLKDREYIPYIFSEGNNDLTPWIFDSSPEINYFFIIK